MPPSDGGPKEQTMRQAGRLLAVATVCAAALTTTVARDGRAQADVQPMHPAVEVVDRTEGRVLPIYWHEGRRYVVGRPGNEYAIRVRNNGNGRILAVISVDGVNVINGDTAAPQQSGYVLAPYTSADIGGWRKSLSRTAAFYFTALPDSYAARTGRPDNVGVIGVAVYRERTVPIAREDTRHREIARAESAAAQPPVQAAAPPGARAESAAAQPPVQAAAPSAAANAATDAMAQAAGERLGTGHGRAESSYASYTQFERASDTPAQTIAIYYDSYENLLALGVPVASPQLARFHPNPFPDSGRFVPDPR
jgi:hypothetical protein